MVRLHLGALHSMLLLLRAMVKLLICCWRKVSGAQDPQNSGFCCTAPSALHASKFLIISTLGFLFAVFSQGADINAEDVNGDTALSVASRFGHKGCERHLFLFRWQQRAKQMHPQAPHEMFAHQYFDSAFPVWLKGRHAQVYYTKILPPTEFQGTGFGAPRHKDLHQELSESSDESEEELVWEEEEEEDEGSPSGLEDGRLLRSEFCDLVVVFGLI